MPEIFTASNGQRISRTWGAYPLRVASAHISKKDVDALREYFLAERDKELGRWRDPEYPNIFVRVGSGPGDWVGVVKDDENGLAYGQFHRDDNKTLDPMSIVAKRYFDAHPEKKPWHDARAGEVWKFEFMSGDSVLQFDGTYWMHSDGYAHDVYRAVSATRIWPEAK